MAWNLYWNQDIPMPYHEHIIRHRNPICSEGSFSLNEAFWHFLRRFFWYYSNGARWRHNDIIKTCQWVHFFLFFIIFRHSLTCDIERCNSNEYVKILFFLGGGAKLPHSGGSKKPHSIPRPPGHQCQKNFPSDLMNFFMNSCKRRTHRNILQFSYYLVKTMRGGGNFAPPTWNRVKKLHSSKITIFDLSSEFSRFFTKYC